jgi:hypothetical protein
MLFTSKNKLTKIKSIIDLIEDMQSVSETRRVIRNNIIPLFHCENSFLFTLDADYHAQIENPKAEVIKVNT